MRYVVWHTPRVGSNMVMNMLHQTGIAGIRDYIQCGFYLGRLETPDMETTYEAKVAAYFANQRTANGVEACKASLQYFEELLPIVKHDRVHRTLQMFDKAILLSRHDKVAQAVSMMFGATDGRFKASLVSPPEYRPERIRWTIARFAGMELRMRVFWGDMPIYYYEDVVADMEGTIASIIKHLGIKEPYTFRPPAIEKQSHPLKAEYIQRYKDQYGLP